MNDSFTLKVVYLNVYSCSIFEMNKSYSKSVKNLLSQDRQLTLYFRKLERIFFKIFNQEIINLIIFKNKFNNIQESIILIIFIQDFFYDCYHNGHQL